MKLSSTLQRFISLVFPVALCGGYAHAQRLIVVGWNIESGGATDAAVAQRVRRFQGVDLWGLAEVQSDASLRSFEMVNHLARGDNTLRHNQGQRLNEWVRAQTLPVIACGDYNFDWSVTNGEQ